MKPIKLTSGISYMTDVLPVGSKIRFAEEKQSFTVQASNVAFSICTKPFNPKKTVLYSVISWFEDIRGTENLIFGMGAETKEQCEEMLERLTKGESEVSERHRIPLKIDFIMVEIKQGRKKNKKFIIK